MDNDYAPRSSESEDFQLEISIEPEGTLADVPEPMERPYQPAVLTLELAESDPFSSVLATGELIPTTSSFNQWEPVERPLKQQSSNFLGSALLRRQLSEGRSTKRQKDELLGIADNELLPTTEDNLIAPSKSSSKSYDATDRPHSFYVGQSEIEDVVKPDLLSRIYTLGSIESTSKHDPLSTDPSKSQSIFRPPGLNRVDGQNSNEDFHPRQ